MIVLMHPTPVHFIFLGEVELVSKMVKPVKKEEGRAPISVSGVDEKFGSESTTFSMGLCVLLVLSGANKGRPRTTLPPDTKEQKDYETEPPAAAVNGTARQARSQFAGRRAAISFTNAGFPRPEWVLTTTDQDARRCGTCASSQRTPKESAELISRPLSDAQEKSTRSAAFYVRYQYVFRRQRCPACQKY